MSDRAGADETAFWGDTDETEALQRYRTLVNTIDDGIYQLDTEGRFVAVNDVIVEMTGYARGDLLGEHVSALLGETEVSAIEREIERLRENPSDRSELLNFTVETAEGERVHCEVRVNLLEVDGTVQGTIGIVRDITEREATERRRGERERQRERELERYERIVENLPVGVYRNTPGRDGEFVTGNSTLASIFDADSVDELQEYSVSDLYPNPDQRAEFSRQLEREGIVEDFELKQTTLDGDTIWISVTAIKVEDGDEVYFDGVVQDVTERKRAKQQLEEERSMFAQGPAVVFRWQNEAGWPVEYVSENVEDVLGYAPRELESGDVPYTDLLLDEELDRIAREVEENSNETTERFSHDPYRVKTKDGDVRWVTDTTKIIRDESGEITHYLGYLVDITERKEQRRKIEESERRHRTLVENFPNGAVAMFDEDLRYTTAGGAILEDIGSSREEIVGQTIWDRYPDDLAAQLEPKFRAAIDAGETNTFEMEFHDRHWLAYTLPVRDSNGDIFAGMMMVQDVTERKEYQRKLEESNERLEQFAYAASHDLQEPNRMVSSYLQLLESRYADDLDEDAAEFIEFAVAGADRMRAMIENLLEYSRVTTRGEPLEPTDTESVLEDVLEDLHLQIEETDATVTADELPTVTADADQLGQLFQNLLSNALKYSGDAPPQVHVSTERTDDAWQFSVTDEGIGIDPEYHDRIFTVFEQLQVDGDERDAGGIGLALCERIVERHGGDIWLESEPGQGTTFYFTLPVTRNHQSEPHAETQISE